MIMEESVSADDGPHAPSAPSADRDSNLSASASGQLPVGVGLGFRPASASGQLPVGVGLGFRPASQLQPGPLVPPLAVNGVYVIPPAGQRERGLPRSSGDSGSAGQLERSYLRLSPGIFL